MLESLYMVKEILLADNFGSLNLGEETKLGADAAASQPVIAVENKDGFAVDDYVLVGDVGSGRAEIRKVFSIAGQNITFSTNLTLAHSKYETVTKLLVNTINFYRAANVDGTVPDNLSFSLIASVAIRADDTETVYIDSVGGTGYWYKFTYYNDVSAEETDLTTAQAVRGGAYNRYVDVETVREEAGITNNKYISDAKVLRAIEHAEGQVKASLAAGAYTLPLTEIPQLVQYVTMILAAGFLLRKSYGAQHVGTTKDAKERIDEAIGILTKIENGKISLVITSDDSTVSSGTVTVAGYPDDTAEDRYPSEAPKFRMSDEY